MSILIGKINVKRVLDALSHMGYSTESAISDIVDNSVSANATEVSIKIKASSYGLKNTLEEVHIIDNGTGMDKGQLENCLVLGSSEQYYNQNSLSKFGMGLKSAGLSLGKRISVVSKKGSDFNKIVLDLEKITDEYNLVQEVPTNEDREVLKSFENGTHVKVDNLRKHHLTCKTIMSNLELEMSEIYCPMLQDSTLKIGLIAFSEEQTFDDKEIKPFDPLFESECQEGLNPDTWDGKTPCWLLKKSPIQIKEASTPIYITCTHLVHPPTFSFEDTKLTQL